MKNKKKTAPKSNSRSRKPGLLVADDIDLTPEQGRRSAAVKTCATRLARRLGVAIDLVHVEDIYLYPVRSPQYRPLVERYVGERKTALEESARSFEVPTRTLFVSGAPTSKILSLASRKGAYELIVLGTHGRKGVARLFAGSVAEEVLRQSRVPVMTVGPKAQERGQSLLEGESLRILVPTSLTANSDKAETYAAGLAKRLGAELVLFHAMHESIHPVLQTAFAAPSPAPQMAALFEELKEEARKQLDRRAKRLGRAGVLVSAVLDDRAHSATDAVLRQAESCRASLIVMGTHGRSLLSGAFFGRTARGVILEAESPVITVRSKGA